MTAFAAAFLAAGALLASRSRRSAVGAAALLGAFVGIAVSFLPIVLNVGIPSERFYRLMWFPSWI